MFPKRKKLACSYFIKKTNAALDDVAYTPTQMSSPRTRDFYKQLAAGIRAERALQEQKHKEAVVEMRALEGRLYRLQMWEEICNHLERLQLWEQKCIQDRACSTL